MRAALWFRKQPLAHSGDRIQLPHKWADLAPILPPFDVTNDPNEAPRATCAQRGKADQGCR